MFKCRSMPIWYEILNKLFIFSQTRGSEAAGIAINTGKSIDVYKKAGSPREFVKSLKANFLLMTMFWSPRD